MLKEGARYLQISPNEHMFATYLFGLGGLITAKAYGKVSESDLALLISTVVTAMFGLGLLAEDAAVTYYKDYRVLRKSFQEYGWNESLVTSYYDTNKKWPVSQRAVRRAAQDEGFNSQMKQFEKEKGTDKPPYYRK